MTVRAVHHLNCATMCPVAGFLLGGNGLGAANMVAHCLLLETERDGLVLVDTGFGTRDVEGKTGIPRGSRCSPALPCSTRRRRSHRSARSASSPADVKHIVVTHLDLDHAGGLADFPNAKVHLHAREHAAAMARHDVQGARALPHGALGARPEVGGLHRGRRHLARPTGGHPLRGLDADIGLLPMHGHTRGHSAVIAKTATAGSSTRAMRTSIATRSKATARSRRASRVRARHTDDLAVAASRFGRRRCASWPRRYPDLDMFCAHDPREYAAFSA